MEKSKAVGFDTVVMIAKLTDGSYRQILASEDEINIVLNLLVEFHGGSVKVCEKQIHGIEFNKSN